MSSEEERGLSKLHDLGLPGDRLALPEKFTWPFHYTPHPLCVRAAEEVQAYISSRKEWEEVWSEGKMFGVLVVRTADGDIGFLAAFSGMLAGRNVHDYFVPPVYDLQQTGGFFRPEEEKITALNARIGELTSGTFYLAAGQKLAEERELARRALEEAAETLKVARERREKRRRENPDEAEKAAMVRESQHQKGEYRRLKQYWRQRVEQVEKEADDREAEVQRLKAERRQRSAALQEELFRHFRLLNALGEVRDLCDIFRDTPQGMPPAGAGECAAPKLLQYAYQHGMLPLAMAEFWWGASPRGEIRRQGYYYPACQGKCGPILRYMLQGLVVEEDSLQGEVYDPEDFEVVYEDEWLVVVNKPAGMLSVPGKSGKDSVYDCLKMLCRDALELLLVHRLDMATSGLLLAAKTRNVHRHLQAQFAARTVKKRYVALLEGKVDADEGMVNLPLCLDPSDRPRQMVSETYGRRSLTRYRVTARERGRTRVLFYPLTGRTHQLRVHAAHPLGLQAPIVGDELYGMKAERLYLHAEYLEFVHPVTGGLMHLEKKAPF